MGRSKFFKMYKSIIKLYLICELKTAANYNIEYSSIKLLLYRRLKLCMQFRQVEANLLGKETDTIVL